MSKFFSWKEIVRDWKGESYSGRGEVYFRIFLVSVTLGLPVLCSWAYNHDLCNARAIYLKVDRHVCHTDVGPDMIDKLWEKSAAEAAQQSGITQELIKLEERLKQ